MVFTKYFKNFLPSVVELLRIIERVVAVFKVSFTQLRLPYVKNDLKIIAGRFSSISPELDDITLVFSSVQMEKNGSYKNVFV